MRFLPLKTKRRVLPSHRISTTHTHPQQDGFAALDPRISIVRVRLEPAAAAGVRLPIAHTCSRSMDLPEYASEAQLKERLALALAHVDDEFGFA